jgi:hypothetical protein
MVDQRFAVIASLLLAGMHQLHDESLQKKYRGNPGEIVFAHDDQKVKLYFKD